MSYLVLARKWRPKKFSEVVGQQHVLNALINGLDNSRLHHALLFTGTRGVGKTTLARIFAKSLNCEQGVSSVPCGDCPTCQEVDAGRFVDLIEVDAASRTKVDDTRELLDNVQYTPSRGRYKVYLIDEVHMLSKHSFNALLKTLEEPPPHVKFLFATTDPQQLPATILSRCMQLNLRRLDVAQIADHLAVILKQEMMEFERSALTVIARAADGSMRDALSLLDGAISFCKDHITAEKINQMLGTISSQQVHIMVSALIDNDSDTLLQQAEELVANGRRVDAALDDILATLQRIASIQVAPKLAHTDETNFKQLQILAKQISPELTQLFYQIALHGKRDLPYAADPKSGFEMTLLRMLSFTPNYTDDNSDTLLIKKNKQTAIKPSPQNQQQDGANSHQPVAASIPATQSNPVKPKAKATATCHNQTLHVDNWFTVINDLKLTGLARQLADNSVFISLKKDTVTLAITPDLAHLANEKTSRRLGAALSDYLGSSIKLIFTEDAQNQSGQTLANEQVEKAKIKQDQAIHSIHHDKAVDTMKQTFGASVIEDTIKPLKAKGESNERRHE